MVFDPTRRLRVPTPPLRRTRGPDGRPSLQPREPGSGPHRLPRGPGRGPFQPAIIPKPQFKELPNAPWWEPLLVAATVETAVAGVFLAPMGIVADRYLDQKDEINMQPLFTPCGSELHLRERELFPERHLGDMERLRRNLRWYSDGDQMKGKLLGHDIEKLKIVIADMQRRRQINELQTRLNGLNPGSTEAQRLHQQMQSLESAMGTTIPSPVGIGASASASASAASPVQSSPARLDAGDWDPFNRRRLEELLASHGIGSPAYDPARRPYVVFDFDNTTIFLDIEEAVLVFQLYNLRFHMTPDQLNRVIRTGVPTGDFLPVYNNAAGQVVNIDTIAPDIVASYTWLYQHYRGFQAGGQWSLEKIQHFPHYQNFTTKLRYLYEAIGGTFAHTVSYPWITYLFTGMTGDQVRQLAAETIQWQQTQPIQKVKWTSPSDLPGQAGVVSVTWRNGLRMVPEMQNLYRAFREAGFDVWICSASFVDVIREFSSNPLFGYNNPPDRVLAMELERDANGVIQPEYRHGFEQTQGPGKTHAIRRRLVGHYGYGPVFIAGDSEGDQDMMHDFSSLVWLLIVNRLRDPKTRIGQLSQYAVDEYGHPHARVLLQGRDENTGRFLPRQGSVSFGEVTSRVTVSTREARADAAVAAFPFASDITDARGAGVPRDEMGLRLGQVAIANVEASPHLARMSNGRRPMQDPPAEILPPQEFAQIKDGDFAYTQYGRFFRLAPHLGYYKSTVGSAEGFQLNIPLDGDMQAYFLPIAAVRHVMSGSSAVTLQGGELDIRLQPKGFAEPFFVPTHLDYEVVGMPKRVGHIPWSSAWILNSPGIWHPMLHSGFRDLALGWDLTTLLNARARRQAGEKLLQRIEPKKDQTDYHIGVTVIAALLMDGALETEFASVMVKLFILEGEVGGRVLAHQLAKIAEGKDAPDLQDETFLDEVHSIVTELHIAFPILHDRHLWLWR